jgi:hypothetical protein
MHAYSMVQASIRLVIEQDVSGEPVNRAMKDCWFVLELKNVLEV